jgi:hypothetical protein
VRKPITTLADYFAHFKKTVLPQLKTSGVFLNITPPDGELDVKQCTELGAALLLGKPMLLVVAKGRTIPERLRRYADVVLDDWEPTEGAARIADALKQMGLEDG